eukprot:211469-Chlamydomonas_euryale.AAC.5
MGSVRRSSTAGRHARATLLTRAARWCEPLEAGRGGAGSRSFRRRSPKTTTTAKCGARVG